MTIPSPGSVGSIACSSWSVRMRCCRSAKRCANTFRSLKRPTTTMPVCCWKKTNLKKRRATSIRHCRSHRKRPCIISMQVWPIAARADSIRQRYVSSMCWRKSPNTSVPSNFSRKSISSSVSIKKSSISRCAFGCCARVIPCPCREGFIA